MNRWLERMQGKVWSRNTDELFLRVFYAFWIFNMVRLLPVAGRMWGNEAPIILHDSVTGCGKWAMLLSYPGIREYYLLFLAPFLVLLVIGLLGFHPWPVRLLIWGLFVVLHFGNPEVSNGGYHMTHQLFFLSVFFIGGKAGDESRLASLRNLVHNLAHKAVWIQIALMYGVAALQKLRGDLWPSGDAVAIVLSLEEYSLPWIAESIHRSTWWLQLMSYAALGYQGAFPMLVWSGRIRPYLLVCGLVFHLFIAVVIGIVDFGLILIASYCIFLSDNGAARILEGIRRAFAAGRWRGPTP